MTDLILTNARLINPETGTDSLGCLVVAGGEISQIMDQPTGPARAAAKTRTVDCGGKCLAPGIVDLGVRIGEPGDRHRESFR